jgi:hypothetical protein
MRIISLRERLYRAAKPWPVFALVVGSRLTLAWAAFLLWLVSLVMGPF